MRDATPTLDAAVCRAVDIPDPAARAAYLAAAVADPALRARAEALVAAHFRAGPAFLEPAAAAADATAAYAPAGGGPPDPGVGASVGPYRLRERIGEGGMGAVYLADQEHPVRRAVALKLIKAGMDSAQVVARFEAERQALALMDHPHIARVLDGGAHAGRPYFAMELVRGLPLTDYCDRARLTVRERLALFADVCRAVQHAHTKGVIHRDLKPSNVLVTVVDGRAVPKVIDFGIAKAAGAGAADRGVHTGFHQLVGTPLYMSPEQAELSGVDVDTRADVYALGVLLYELLTGDTPFDREAFRTAGLDEVRRMIREDEPPAPSRRVSTLAAGRASTVADRRGVDPRRLGRAVRGELDWVVMKCLEKDRARRYQTAADLAADVGRHLAGEPVAAHPPSAAYRLSKWVRRHKGRVGVAALAAAAVLAAAGGGGWAAADRAGRRARADERAGEAVARAEAALAAGDPHAADLAAALRQAEVEADGGLVGEPVRRRVERAAADRAMLAELERILLAQTETVAGAFAKRESDQSYARAFREYGVDVDAVEPEAAGLLLRGRPIAARLVAAVDDWAYCRRLKAKADGNPDGWTRLLAVTRVADPDPWRAAVRSAWAAGDKAALAELARSDALAGQPVASLGMLGRTLLDLGDAGAAVAVLRVGQRHHPADFWANHDLAWCLAHSRPPREGEAVGFFRAAVALRPHSTAALLNLGTALSGHGQLEEAAAHLREVVRLHPEYALAQNNLGEVLRKRGQVADALACFREAVRLKPGNAMFQANLGKLLLGLGQLGEAEKCLREAIRLDPEHAAAHVNLGVLLRNRGRREDAMACYREAIRIDPEDATAHTNLGGALLSLRRLPEAEVSLREAIRLKPDSTEARINLGSLRMEQGKMEDAIALFREAIRLQPDSADAFYCLGNALRSQGQLTDAVAAYQEAIRLKPDSPPTLNNLSWLLSTRLNGRHDPQEAVRYARKVVELSPGVWAGWNTLGVALYRAGEWREAADALRKSIDLQKGGTATDFLFLAMAHHKMGDPKAAREWYDRGVAKMDQEAPKDEELAGFRAEAAQVLGLSPPDSPAPKK